MTVPFAVPFGQSLVLDRGEPLPLILLDGTARAAWEDGADRRAETERLLAMAVGAAAPIVRRNSLQECGRRHRSGATQDRKRVYRFGGPPMAVRFRPAWLEALVRHRFRPARAAGSAPAAELSLLAVDGGFVLREPGVRDIAAGCTEALIGAFVRRFVELSNPGARWMAVLHAAAVGDPGLGAVVMPGENGSGKSVLTLALLEAGWSYLSDDCVPIDQTGRAVPAPFAICVKESGWAAASPYLERLATGRPVRGRNGERCRFAQPRSTFPGPAPIGALIFPSFRPGAPATLTRLVPEATLQRLLTARAWISREPSELRAALDLIARTPAFALTYGSTPDAVALIRDAVVRR